MPNASKMPDVNAETAICALENAGTLLDYLPLFITSPCYLFLVQRSQGPESRLGVLPCVRTARPYRKCIEANALADLSARNIAVFQIFEVDKHLVWARELRVCGAGKETGRAGEVDSKDTELGASTRWGVGEAGGEGTGGDGGGVSLSIAERAVGSDVHLLAAGNDNVWTELASCGGKEAEFWRRSREDGNREGSYPLRQCRGVLGLQKRK